MWIKYICFIIFCLIAGNVISAGYIAFITLLGIYDKLMTKLSAVKYSHTIESLIIGGGTIGTILFLFNIPLPFGVAGMTLFNFIGGIFTGCLAGALAETLSIFPILSRRFNIRKGMPYILTSAALGKAVGAFINLYF